MRALFFFVVAWGACCWGVTAGERVVLEETVSVEHRIAAIEEGRFHGWPANNGVWQWENEILVGLTQGDFAVKDGHNIAGRQDSLFARSRDGGNSWVMFDPKGFLDDENPKFLGKGKRVLERPLDFSHPGFALRFFATGYHGNDDPEGGFFYSYDRGETWEGPYLLKGLTDHPEMKGKIFSQRTDYLIQSKDRCFAFITTDDSVANHRRIATIQTKDGGMTFEFVSWVTPVFETARGTMSQTIQLNEREFVLSFRKIESGEGKKSSIEAYQSKDACRSWEPLSTVKVMQVNSNPPALVRMQDGRLCCAYGDRKTAEIRGRYSDDEGGTWGPEFIIRDDFQTVADDPDAGTRLNADMGYVRLVQRPDGRLVAMYYWATAKNPQQHIAVSIWKP
ncbi:MAG: exo-alpha-sialidase [Planctomycetaceae bacterium]|nr:exo-alpha-sialidase [Planctomycetaceae bacterium]